MNKVYEIAHKELMFHAILVSNSKKLKGIFASIDYPL